MENKVFKYHNNLYFNSADGKENYCYLSLDDIEAEFVFSEMENIMPKFEQMKRGDSIRIGADVFECLGTFREMNEDYQKTNERFHRMFRKWAERGKRIMELEAEVKRLSENLEKVSDVLATIMTAAKYSVAVLSDDDVDLVDAKTGELLSK